ncbi:MAG: hypothetical protein GF350_05710 [Chitinivibrionales bacterium]|nr:hypothetical protein [Chitinivibrionales bacterium]
MSVPVIIHLLNRKRTVRLDFSSLRFFRETAVKASRRRKIRHWLLLLVRMLIIAVIAVIFSRPFNNSSPFTILNNPRGAVYCWIDPTMSMEYKTGNVSLWRRARFAVDSLARQIPATADCFLYDHARRKFRNLDKYQAPDEKITRHGRSDFKSMITIFKRDIARRNSVPLLVVFSDFQHPRNSSSERIPDHIHQYLTSGPPGDLPPVVCVLLGERTPKNYSIIQAEISPENPSVCTAKLTATGSPLRNGELVAIAGHTRIGHEIVTVPPGDTIQVDIKLGGENHTSAGKIVLNAPDPFDADNRAYFSLGEQRARRVLILGPTKQSYPLAAAFRALAKETWNPVIVKKPGNVTLNDLDSADLIVLNETSKPTRVLQTLTRGRSLGKKAIIFSPSINTASSSWNNIVFRHLNIQCAPDSSRTGTFPVLPDTLSVTWKGFPEMRNTDIAIYRYCTGISGATLLRMSNDHPLAVAAIDSAGHNWIVLATPLGITDANNICETGFYVPFVDRISRAALAGVQKDTRQWIAGIPRRNPFFGYPSSATIFDAENNLIARWDNQPSVVFSVPGTYRISPSDGAPYRIAVNIDPHETDLTYSKPVIPEAVKQSARVLRAPQFLTFVRDTQQSRSTYILWIMCAVLIAAEMLLWKRS